MAQHHMNILLPNGMFVADSAFFRPILKNRADANGVHPLRAQTPKHERTLFTCQWVRRCLMTEELPCLAYRDHYRQAVLIVERGVVRVLGCVACTPGNGLKKIFSDLRRSLRPCSQVCGVPSGWTDLYSLCRAACASPASPCVRGE